MNILLLGPHSPDLIDYMESLGDTVVRTEKKISGKSAILKGVDFIISYGYRYIIKDDVLTRFKDRIVNLHISLLPWNRGADPNLWSWLEDTPKGVTIHRIDAGIDTGLILAQAKVEFTEDETLRTSYDKLSDKIEQLFIEVWPEIRIGKRDGFNQTGAGTSHRMAEREAFDHLLHSGWDTPVRDIKGKALAEVTGG